MIFSNCINKNSKKFSVCRSTESTNEKKTMKKLMKKTNEETNENQSKPMIICRA